jgi:hypothetical protein
MSSHDSPVHPVRVADPGEIPSPVSSGQAPRSAKKSASLGMKPPSAIHCRAPLDRTAEGGCPHMRVAAAYEGLRLPAAVLLDNVRSMYNVGAFFRAADGVGLQGNVGTDGMSPLFSVTISQ